MMLLLFINYQKIKTQLFVEASMEEIYSNLNLLVSFNVIELILEAVSHCAIC